MARAERDPVAEAGLTPEDQARLAPHVQLALAPWPQIDPAVEGIVTRIARASRQLDAEMRASLEHVGLTKEEFKVLMRLQARPTDPRGALPSARRLDRRNDQPPRQARGGRVGEPLAGPERPPRRDART